MYKPEAGSGHGTSTESLENIARVRPVDIHTKIHLTNISQTLNISAYHLYREEDACFISNKPFFFFIRSQLNLSEY